MFYMALKAVSGLVSVFGLCLLLLVLIGLGRTIFFAGKTCYVLFREPGLRTIRDVLFSRDFVDPYLFLCMIHMFFCLTVMSWLQHQSMSTDTAMNILGVLWTFSPLIVGGLFKLGRTDLLLEWLEKYFSAEEKIPQAIVVKHG